MSYFLKKYLSENAKSKEFEFHYAYILLKNGDEIFTQIAEIDTTSYLMKSPLRVIREYSDESRSFSLGFEQFCPFSSDVFIRIKEADITVNTELEDSHIKLYVESIEKINDVNRSFNESIEDEFDEEFDDESVEEPSGNSNNTYH